MGYSFGTDFSDVNVHANSDKAIEIGALAYAQGSDVHFAPGQFNPDSQKGQELIGHELAHVVQQKEGRVSAKKQGAGMPINDDPGLEKEADEMGARAAQGKMADVQKKGSGVQKKDGKTDIVLRDFWGKETELAGVSLKGAIYRKYINSGGEEKIYIKNYIIAPTKQQWIQLLKHGESYYFKYIYGFLYACNNKAWNSQSSQEVLEADMNGNGVVNTDYFYVEDGSDIAAEQKADFLEALYAVGRDEKDVKMPKSGFFNPVTPQWTQTYSQLGSFIANNQNLLVERLATDNRILSSEGLQNVAGMGVDSKSPLAPEMIANAYASAVACAKIVIEELAVEMSNAMDPSKPVALGTSYSDRISKYAMIIDDALMGYDAELKNIADRSKALFELAWSLVPFGSALDKISSPVIKQIASAAVEQAKIKLGNEIGKKSETKLSTKREFGDQFRATVNTLIEPLNGFVGSQLSQNDIKNSIRSLKNSFK